MSFKILKGGDKSNHTEMTAVPDTNVAEESIKVHLYFLARASFYSDEVGIAFDVRGPRIESRSEWSIFSVLHLAPHLKKLAGLQ